MQTFSSREAEERLCAVESLLAEPLRGSTENTNICTTPAFRTWFGALIRAES